MSQHLHLRPEDPESRFDSDEEEQPQVTNLSRSSAAQVHADLVRMHQSAAQEITAEEVEIHQGAAAQVQATRVSGHEAAIVMLNAAEAQMVNTGVGGVRAENVHVDGYAGAVFAETVEMGNTIAGMIAAQEVRGERIESVVLLARHVEGEVRTLMDTRTALIAGMTGGLFAGMIYLLGRVLFRRREDR